MQIQPIRSWLTAAHVCGPGWYWPLRCRFSLGKRFFLVPTQPDSVVARDDRLVLRAQLLELVGIEPPELSLSMPEEPSRLELHWPSDEKPPTHQTTPPSVVEQVIRPWPPEHVMGSVLDLLT